MLGRKVNPTMRVQLLADPSRARVCGQVKTLYGQELVAA